MYKKTKLEHNNNTSQIHEIPLKSSCIYILKQELFSMFINSIAKMANIVKLKKYKVLQINLVIIYHKNKFL